MSKLIETKLQKLILLIGALIIFLRLFNVNYYDSYGAILFCIGVALLTFVLLVILQNYRFVLTLKSKIILSTVVLVVLLFTLFTRINVEFFTLDRNQCIKKLAADHLSQEVSAIDTGAFIKDLKSVYAPPNIIDKISLLYGIDKSIINDAIKKDENLIAETNRNNLLFIAEHPGWADNNLMKVKDLIGSRTYSQKHLDEINSIASNDPSCNPPFWKE
jgi:hypothetical protein